MRNHDERPLSNKPFEEDEEGQPAPSEAAVLKRFEEVWSAIFTSPIHLDSALAKLPKNTKSTVAQLVPQILLRPISLAEQLGIGVAGGEPWSLSGPKLAQWRTARLLAERIHRGMSQRIETPTPQPADFPEPMVRAWEQSWGREGMLELVRQLGTEAPLSLRASRRVGAPAVLAELTQGSRLPVKAVLSDFAPLGVRLSGYAAVMGGDLYKNGGFEIQDEGSQLMALFALWPETFAPLLSERPGAVRAPASLPALPSDVPAWTVVDACAGAGGKTLALADVMGNKGRLFSYDVSATKLQALRRRAQRGGFTNIQTVAVQEGNESEVVSRFRRRANRVLVDAPCSGWGVLRRNPDIKWRQDGEFFDRLPELQLRLLSEYSGLVAPGGLLTFGVCTFRKEETVDVATRFLESQPDFERGPGGYLGPGPCDGFFMQSFRRASK
jgi:16S rRNA C967 or C1407 C5-methylase (RsmB/RsmF family)